MLLKGFSLHKGITIFDDAHLYLPNIDRYTCFTEKIDKLFPKWIKILEQCGLNGEVLGLGFKTLGKVLELNCMNGKLTYAFAKAGEFQEFHTVSSDFNCIKQANSKIATLSRKNLLYYLTSKDDYPFKLGYFDLVMGNCIFLNNTNYQSILEKSYTLIAPHGHGKMILYEPLFRTAKDLNFLIHSLLQLHEDFSLNIFSLKEKNTLLDLVVAKSREENDSLTQEAEPIILNEAYIQELGLSIGFTKFRCIPDKSLKLRGLRTSLCLLFQKVQIDVCRSNKFSKLFELLEAKVDENKGIDRSLYMGFLIFSK